MAFEVVMPKWGLSMQEGLIIQWLKQEGETVEKDEPLLEVETEKMVSVVESPAAGILARILQPAESRVPVSQAIALIAAPGETVADVALSGEAAPDPSVAGPAVFSEVPDGTRTPAPSAHGPAPPAPPPSTPASTGVVRAMPAALG